MLWVDKYRPKDLDSMEVHPEISKSLVKLVAQGDFPHLLFYGSSGAGKKTRVMALLRHYFGDSALKLKTEHKAFKVSDSKTVDVTTLSSNHHIEVNPSEVGYYDRVVVMTMVKEIAESAPLDSSATRGFKVVVLNEVDQLTRGAQQALRRTMEKYMATCRLILIATSISKLIEPLRSRCLGIRIPAPSDEEISSVLHSVAKKEGVALPQPFADRIVAGCDRNLRRAVLMLEAAKVQKYPFTPDQEVVLSDWQRFVAQIAKDICIEQSPRQILEVRGRFYELLSNCIPAEVILRTLAECLIGHVDMAMKCEVVHWAAHYEHHLKLGSKAVYHLEAFVCKFMYLYKKHNAGL